ncbi:MAG: FmdB family zinc ribbon protein [Planctomycetota bacterium]
MPIFEYQCRKCGKRTEFLETSGKPASKTCSHCDSPELQKLFSTFSPRINPGQSKKCHGCTDFKCPHSGN